VEVVLLEGPFEAYAYQELTFRPYIPCLLSARPLGGAPFFAVGAQQDGEPVGLGLFQRFGKHAELLSIYVADPFRRRGIATRILERAWSELNVGRIEASLERGRPGRDAAEALLLKHGYGPFQRAALMCRFQSGEKVRKAPWLRRLSIPAAFEVFDWKDLRVHERKHLEERRELIPGNLYPFLGEEYFEPLNSLGLRYKGEVVAWQVNHRPLPDLVRYTYTYARPDLQQFGLALALMSESVRRHLDGPLAQLAHKATFKVPAEYEGMTRFVEKNWTPYADEINEIVRGAKTR
jgi:GNAT superfamily N-acetyltransferase